MSETLIKTSKDAVAVRPVRQESWTAFLKAAPQGLAWSATQAGFKGARGQVLAVPAAEGAGPVVLLGLGAGDDPTVYRALPGRLAAGDYKIEGRGLDHQAIALNWAIGTYRFDRYRKNDSSPARLVIGKGVDLAEATAVAHACALARDMVNTPANDMGPLQIETISREIAEKFGASLSVVTGDDLLAQNYPAVHAVGRAAVPHRAPRMIEISWGKAGPLIAIIGKGVVFDTGGLDLKPSSGMRLMKKDMGGAAHALALARMVMAAKLKLRLVVLVPAVENAIAGDAMRPGDVIASRKGLSIEVGNTDAEGRLILADALARAAELAPDLTIDLATLTGAARAALGPQVIPFYTDDDTLAADLADAAKAQADPLWRMPLWAGYEDAVDSDIADVTNDSAAWAQAGSVTAALFLKRFAPQGLWVHFDIFAWNPRVRPGYPLGAEVQAIRALYAVLKARHS